MIRDHLIEPESRPLGLGPLVLQGLVGGAHPAIENGFHPGSFLSPEVLSGLGIVPKAIPTLADGHCGLFRASPWPCPCGHSPKQVDRMVLGGVTIP